MSATLLLAWGLAAPARLVEVRSEQVEGRAAVVVVAAGPLEGVSVERDGRDVVMSLAAAAPAGLTPPVVSAPLEALRIERGPHGVRLLVRVAPEVSYELRREPAHEGLHLGTVLFKPAATLAYVDADVAVLDTPRPVRDHYAEARPALGVDIPLRDGLLGLDYEARIRRFSEFAEVNDITHQGNAHLQYPAGTSLALRGSAHVAVGLLETTEVDPGGEYFYGLSRFTRWQFGAGFRANTGSRFDLDVSGALDNVNVDQDTHAFYAQLGMGFGVEPSRP